MEFVSWQLAYLEIINDSICVIIIDTTLKWWITNSGEKMINLCENLFTTHSRQLQQIGQTLSSWKSCFFFFSLNFKFYFIFK